MIVPFVRELKIPMVGRDVKAVKRALRKAEIHTNNTNFVYGTNAARCVKEFQEKHNLKADGIYGRLTHNALKPYYDAFGVWLLLHTYVAPPPRKRLVAAAIYSYNYRERIHYTEDSRRMTIVRNKLTIPFSIELWEDCSSMVTGDFFIAKLPDPNNLNYSGYGYTGTLCKQGTEVSVPHPGDLNFYGRESDGFSHVTIAVGDDISKEAKNCVSHGSESGPLLLPINYRGDLAMHRSYVV